MARPLRVHTGGAVYDVIAVGNARHHIFRDDHDRRHFLERLWRTAARRDWIVWAYCLMDDHAHLLVQTVQPTLARGMRDLLSRYALEFNKRWGRVGHVFRSRYTCRFVQPDRFLLPLSRHIVLAPVGAKLCRHPVEWRWSSYRDIVGWRIGNASPRLAIRATLDLFAPTASAARRKYQDFVIAGIGSPPPSVHPHHPLVYGDDPFLATVMGSIDGQPSNEIPRWQRVVPLLPAIASRAASRNDAIRRAHATGRFRVGELGRYFHLHPMTIRRIVKNVIVETAVDDVAMQDLTPKRRAL